MPAVRHLLPSQVPGALSRNGQVEQLLALEATDDDRSVVRWLTLGTNRDGVALRIHVCEDVGSAEFADVSAFPPADPDEDFGEGVVLAAGADVDRLLRIALAHGASPDRWVNFGVIGEEYLDARQSADDD